MSYTSLRNIFLAINIGDKSIQLLSVTCWSTAGRVFEPSTEILRLRDISFFMIFNENGDNVTRNDIEELRKDEKTWENFK
jgi:hypothetical protein